MKIATSGLALVDTIKLPDTLKRIEQHFATYFSPLLIRYSSFE